MSLGPLRVDIFLPPLGAQIPTNRQPTNQPNKQTNPSDGWNDRFDVVERQEDIALGGISIRIHSPYVHDFDHYYFQLNPFNNQRNPWFAEFWEQRFQCNLPDQQVAPSVQGQSAQQQQPRSFVRPPSPRLYNRSCSGRESLRHNYKQDAKMAFVQKSIITMALGLDSMQRALCASKRKAGLCAEMLPINGSTFLQHLMNVSFSFLDEQVYFDEQGDPPGKYDILNFQRRPTSGQLEQVHNRLPGEWSLAAGDAQSFTPGGGGGGGGSSAPSSPEAPSDSYSTLRVFSPLSRPVQRRHLMGEQSARQRHRETSPTSEERAKAAQLAPSNEQTGAAYSSSTDFEYVQVGSWKSTDGLSLFGQIHWPSGASAHWQQVSAGAAWPAPSSGVSNAGEQQPQQPQQAQAVPGSVIGGQHSSRGEAEVGEREEEKRTKQIGSSNNNNNWWLQQQSLNEARQSVGIFPELAPALLPPPQPPLQQPAWRPTEAALNASSARTTIVAPKSVYSLPCARGHAKVNALSHLFYTLAARQTDWRPELGARGHARCPCTSGANSANSATLINHSFGPSAAARSSSKRARPHFARPPAEQPQWTGARERPESGCELEPEWRRRRRRR